MQRTKQPPRSLHQWRPRRIQQLIPHHKNAPLPYRRHILPGLHLIRLRGIRFPACRRPRQHNHLRPCICHLRVSHLFSSWNNHFAAANLHQLRHPRRRTNPRIRPSLAIYSHASLHSPCRAGNHRKFRTHPPNQCLRLRRPPRNSSQQPNVCVNVIQRSRVHRQEIQRLLQQFPDGLLFVRHRPNDQRRPQRHDVRHRLHVPAIPNLWQSRHRRNVATPFRHAHQKPPRPHRAQNRSSARRQRHNPQYGLFRRGHASSVAECVPVVYPSLHPVGQPFLAVLFASTSSTLTSQHPCVALSRRNPCEVS